MHKNTINRSNSNDDQKEYQYEEEEFVYSEIEEYEYSEEEEYDHTLRKKKIKSRKKVRTYKRCKKLNKKKKKHKKKKRKRMFTDQSSSPVFSPTKKKRRRLNMENMMEEMDVCTPGISDFIKANIIAHEQQLQEKKSQQKSMNTGMDTHVQYPPLFPVQMSPSEMKTSAVPLKNTQLTSDILQKLQKVLSFANAPAQNLETNGTHVPSAFNNKIFLVLKELEKKLNVNKSENGRVHQPSTAKYPTILNIPLSFVDIHLYDNHPQKNMQRKKIMDAWMNEHQHILSEIESKSMVDPMTVLQLSTSLICIQKLRVELESESQMVCQRRLSFDQKLRECKNKYYQWKLDWNEKKAQLDQRMHECQSERELASQQMMEINAEINETLNVVAVGAQCSISMAKGIHCQLVRGMGKIHELGKIQECIECRVAFYKKIETFFSESLAKNNLECERFCQKMKFVLTFGDSLLRRKSEMAKKAQVLEKSYLMAISMVNGQLKK